MIRKAQVKEFVDRLLSPFRPSLVPPNNWYSLYRRPLFDLGDTNPALRGIFSPLYDQETVAHYVHALFQENAQGYAERYTDTAYFLRLLSDAFTRIERREEKRGGLQILDIGSGAGNTIFPLLTLCPDALVIASDLSLDLLVLLKKALAETERAGSCALLQLNAEELDFLPESFDLVVGSAVLHHLFAPEKVFAGCARLLKPGGCAIFFEPFEAGNAVLCLIYRAILDDPKSTSLPTEVVACLRSQINECKVRQGRDKTLPVFQEYEDKWLFTQRYIGDMAHQYGFTSVEMYPIHACEQPFTRQTEVILRLAIEREPDALAPWAWEIIQTYDQHFSADLKSDLLIEGGIILKK